MSSRVIYDPTNQWVLRRDRSPDSLGSVDVGEVSGSELVVEQSYGRMKRGNQ